MKLNIIAVILLIYILAVYIYVYTVPWLKGTMVDDDKCKELGWPCKKESYCCRDPRKGNAFCVTKKCSSIRLEKASDESETFFNISLIITTISIILVMIIKHYYLVLY
jgi:hypothetical protein